MILDKHKPKVILSKLVLYIYLNYTYNVVYLYVLDTKHFKTLQSLEIVQLINN